MKINLRDYPKLKQYLREGTYEEVHRSHLVGGEFYCSLLFDITAEDVEDYTDEYEVNDLPPDIIGLWLSNTTTVNDYYGVEWCAITGLVKVERKERQITEVYYEPV